MKTTKFKNLFLIASFFLLSTISYGQTKEETISWLKEKLTKNLVGRSSDTILTKIDLNECEIKITFEEQTKPGYQLILPTKDLNIGEDGFQTKNTSIGFINYHNNPITYSSFANCFHLQFSEKDLKERIKKALDHLSTFGVEKKKETF